MIEGGNLSKRYGTTLAVDGLSFVVQPGMVTGFLGPNGAGKTITMRMIAGLDQPTGGRVIVNGGDYRSATAPMAELGVLLEARAVHTGRSARNHLLGRIPRHQHPRAPQPPRRWRHDHHPDTHHDTDNEQWPHRAAGHPGPGPVLRMDQIPLPAIDRLHPADRRRVETTGFEPGATAISTSLTGTFFAQLAIGALGVLLITGEYSTGMIRSSLTVVPSRLPMLWGKLAAGFTSFFIGQALLGDQLSSARRCPTQVHCGPSSGRRCI